MSRSKLAASACILVLTACGQSIGVRAHGCSIATPSILTAEVQNAEDKPATGVEIVADFYHNYRFVRVVGRATLTPVLDPGKARHVAMPVATSNLTGVAPMHCTITYASFGDGTAEGAPIAQ